MTRGPKQQRLADYVAPANDATLDHLGSRWSQGASLLRQYAAELQQRSDQIGDDPDFTGDTAKTAKKSFAHSSKTMTDKAHELGKGSEAFHAAAGAVRHARSKSEEFAKHDGDAPPSRPDVTPGSNDPEDVRKMHDFNTATASYWDGYHAREAAADTAITHLETNHTTQAKVFQQIHGEPPPAPPTGPPTTPTTHSGPTPTSFVPTHGGGHDGPGWTPPPPPPPLRPAASSAPAPAASAPAASAASATSPPPPFDPPGPYDPPGPVDPQPPLGTPTGPGVTTTPPGVSTPHLPAVGGGAGAVGGLGAASGGALGGAAAAGLAGGLVGGGLNGLMPLGGAGGRGLSAAGVRGIGSIGARGTGAGSVLGRGSGAGAGVRGAGAGGTGGRGSGRGTGGRGSGGRGAGRGGRGSARGTAGSRGAGAGAGGTGRGRGGKDKKRQGEERDLFDDGADWIDDEGAAPEVLD